MASVKYFYQTGLTGSGILGEFVLFEINCQLFEALVVGSKKHEYLSQSLAHLCNSFLSIRGLPCMLQLNELVLK